MGEDHQIISIAALYKKVIDTIKLVASKWWILLICASLGASLGYFIKPERQFIAKKSYLLKGSSKKRGFLSLASSFGIGGGTAVDFNKVNAIAQSDKMKFDLLLESVNIENRKSTVAQELIKEYEFDVKWAKNRERYLGINFSDSSAVRDSVLFYLLGKLQKNIEISETKDGVVEILTLSKNPFLAFQMNNLFTKNIESYFYNFSLQDEIKRKALLDNKIDSISYELRLAEDRYAELKDITTKVIRFEGLKSLRRLERELGLLNRMYLELFSQRELLNFQIDQQSSAFEILDKPMFPLRKSGRGAIIYIGLGAFLGGVFSTIGIIISNYLSSLRKEISA